MLFLAINRTATEHEIIYDKTHNKKLEKLTGSTSLPFSASDVIRNLSSYTLTSDEEEILKFG